MAEAIISDAGPDWNFIVGKEHFWLVGYIPNKKDKHGHLTSGVTVAGGVDLHAWNKHDLESFKLGPDLTEKLLPYSGKRGLDALLALSKAKQKALDEFRAQNLKDGRPSSPFSVLGVKEIKRAHVNGDSTSSYDFSDIAPTKKPSQFISSQDGFHGLHLTLHEAQTLQAAVQRKALDDLSQHYNAHSKVKFNKLPSSVQTALLSLKWQTGNIWSAKNQSHDVFMAATKQDWDDVVDSFSVMNTESKADHDRRITEAALIRAEYKISASKVGPKYKAFIGRTIEKGAIRSRTA